MPLSEPERRTLGQTHESGDRRENRTPSERKLWRLETNWDWRFGIEDRLRPGYRVYYGVDGDDLILLVEGTKSSQSADIEKAKSFWMDYKERKRNAQKARLQSGPSRRSKK